MYVYLAGPIKGMTYREARAWRLGASKYLEDVSHGKIACLDPLRFQEYRDDGPEAIHSHDDSKVLSSSKFLTVQDRFDVKRSDLVLVNFLRAPSVSIGTVMEAAWADAWQKPIFLVMEDENAHRHPMLETVATHRFTDMDSALEAAWQFLLP